MAARKKKAAAKGGGPDHHQVAHEGGGKKCNVSGDFYARVRRGRARPPEGRRGARARQQAQDAAAAGPLGRPVFGGRGPRGRRRAGPRFVRGPRRAAPRARASVKPTRNSRSSVARRSTPPEASRAARPGGRARGSRARRLLDRVRDRLRVAERQLVRDRDAVREREEREEVRRAARPRASAASARNSECAAVDETREPRHPDRKAPVDLGRRRGRAAAARRERARGHDAVDRERLLQRREAQVLEPPAAPAERPLLGVATRAPTSRPGAAGSTSSSPRGRARRGTARTSERSSPSRRARKKNWPSSVRRRRAAPSRPRSS